MRKISKVQRSQIKRVMLSHSENGTYLFLYDCETDGPCIYDLWFESLEDLYEYCKTEFGIRTDEWNEIPDEPPGCQQDWIASVRIKGRDKEEPRFGEYERFDHGTWIDAKPD